MALRLTRAAVRRVAGELLRGEDEPRFTAEEQATHRARRDASRRSLMERKQDTRHKIQLGGLVVKAGLGEESSAVLLGLLVEAARALAGPKGAGLRARFETAGKARFERGERESAGGAASSDP